MDAPKNPAAQTSVALAGAHQLVLTPGKMLDELQIRSTQTGQAMLTISVGADGVSVRVAGASVVIEATEMLRLEAKRLVLAALQELVVESGGTAEMRIAGELSVAAAAQTLVSTEGDFRVQANDDVRLDGERIRLNCD
jgi:hypothetical protein